jgi:2'-hydroxyisoflavone reductase
VTLVEHGTTGTFNAVGPTPPARWGDVLDACVQAGGGARLAWVPTAWLEAHDMGNEDAFPIWSPPVGKLAGFHRWNNHRAVEAGLTLRPVSDTVSALRAWFPGELERRARVTRELAAKARGPRDPKPAADPSALRAGPSRAREQELLATWHAK